VAAKRVTPAISNAAMRHPRIAQAASAAEAYIGILQGKGAASAWSRQGEASAVASTLRKVERPTIIDVGANIGEWTTFVSRYLARPADFVLIEPSSAHTDGLQHLNIPGSTTIVVKAISAESGRATLRATFAGAGNTSLLDRRDTYFGEFTEQEEVDVTTLDELTEELQLTGQLDFVKIDVEGKELAVLRGARSLLEQSRVGALSFEFGSACISARVFFRDFWDLLVEHHEFALFRIAPGGVLLPVGRYDESLEHFRGVTNYLGVHAAV